MALRSVAARLASRGTSVPRALAPVARQLHATSARFADDASAAGGGLTLNFTVPSKSLYTEAQVEMVILPGGDGMFGVMPSHVPTITELKPGVVSVQETAGGPLSKYFVSGGFASGEHRSRGACIAWPDAWGEGWMRARALPYMICTLRTSPCTFCALRTVVSAPDQPAHAPLPFPTGSP